MGWHNVMWGSDYPHFEGTFGHTQKTLHELFDGVDEEVSRRIRIGAFQELFPHVPPAPADEKAGDSSGPALPPPATAELATGFATDKRRELPAMLPPAIETDAGEAKAVSANTDPAPAPTPQGPRDVPSQAATVLACPAPRASAHRAPRRVAPACAFLRAPPDASAPA